MPNLAFKIIYVAALVAELAIRVPVEEQMMLEQFGDEYREYMRRVGRVLPRLG